MTENGAGRPDAPGELTGLDEDADETRVSDGSRHADDRTIVVDRAAGPAHDLDEQTVVVSRPAPDEEDERTVVVSRPAPDEEDERTVVVSRPTPDEDAERTVVVSRPTLDDDVDERTIAVSRPAPDADADADERTIAVARETDDDAPRIPQDDQTIVTGPDDLDHDGRTVVVERLATPDADTVVSTPRSVSASSESRPMARPPVRRSRRRAITLPPGEAVSDRVAVPAVGPNAVATYEPRTIARPPVWRSASETTPAASRETTTLVSVARRSRVAAVTTLALVVGAAVVSVGGLVILATAVFA
ncbi:MAG: hypothetical protein ABW040_10770 [Microbacteriaceae bacterium]